MLRENKCCYEKGINVWRLSSLHLLSTVKVRYLIVLKEIVSMSCILLETCHVQKVCDGWFVNDASNTNGDDYGRE